MADQFNQTSHSPDPPPGDSDGDRSSQVAEFALESRPPLYIGESISLAGTPDGELARPLAIHPLDRRSDEPRSSEHREEDQAARIRLAWAKLLWLLAFLAVLLGISYLVPLIAENTQYAVTRGRQRAEHDFAVEHLPGSPLVELSRASQMVTQVVAPCVVHINTQGNSPELFTVPMRGLRSQTPTEGQGSGFIVDPSGYILTNAHVIRGSSEISVTLADGRKVSGRVVSIDDPTDLALLKVEADKLTAVRWGDSDQVEPGAMVWAMGSPFGLERSITSGILSAKNRAGLAGTAYQNFLQTDTAVNPGNSGGPLVNTEGRVIGVNTAIVGEAYQGISFAIPSNVAKTIFEQLRDAGTVRRGWLGVQLEDMTEQHARDLGLPRAAGAYIADLVDQGDGGSPAAKAGIQAGDVVVKWNDRAIIDRAQLSNAVADTEIGSKARVVLFRQGQELQFDVIVGLRPPLP